MIGEMMAANKGKELSRAEAMEVFHQDGILEIVFGVTLLNFGFDILNGVTITSLLTYIPIILMSAMKKQMTLPRIGYDSYNGDETKVRNWNLFYAVGMVITLIALSMFVLNDYLNIRASLSLPFGRYLPSLFTGVILSLAALAGAVLIPLKRLYAYSAAALVMGLISFFFFPAQVITVTFAGILLGNGARLMINFSKKYPLDKEETKNPGNKKK
jgi:hypothetical protein